VLYLSGMAARTQPDRGTPEQLLQSLVKHLSHHALWEAVLIVLPPLATIVYCLFYLYSAAWMNPSVALLLAAIAVAIGGLAVATRYRPKVPSVTTAARLLDDRAAGQDRFLTLATIAESSASSPLLLRLRAEADRLRGRVAVQREFPFRVNPHVYVSLVVSLAAAALFPLLLPLAHSTLSPQSAPERLRDLARTMSARPNLQPAGHSLQDLAAKLEDLKMTPEEKQKLAHDERQKIQELQKEQTERQDRDLLNQAAGTLQGIEQQASGQARKQEQSGTGGVESNLPRQGPDDGKRTDGSDGGKESQNTQQDDGMRQGKMAKTNPPDADKQKSSSDKSGSAGNQPEPNQAGKNPTKERPDKTNGAKTEQAGRSKAPEDVPQDAPPAERFYKPGEGEYKGIKGAGYVTVQLPEEVASSGNGGGQKKDARGGKAAASQVPVHNVPLPKHMPDAPAEKQPMPLEYRGIIR
jgi:hypothetical protein